MTTPLAQPTNAGFDHNVKGSSTPPYGPEIIVSRMPSIDVEGEATALRNYWSNRDIMIRHDREILALTKPLPKKDITQWVLNQPKVFYDTAVALLSSNPPRFRMPLTINYEDSERDRMSKSERFLLGIHRALEDHHYRLGRGSWLRELAYWVCSGWVSVFVKVLKEEDDVRFLAEPYDPITCYPQWDSKGLCRFARVFEVDNASAMAMAEAWAVDYQPDDPEVNVTVINYWRRLYGKAYNSIMIGGKTIKPLTDEGKTIPIFISTVGVPEKTSADWQQRIGENLIAANRDMYAYHNEMISLAAENVKENAKPGLVSKTHSGRPAAKKEDVGKGKMTPIRFGESIEQLRTVNIPPELYNMVGILDSNLQKGSLPNVVYGGINVELSGFAISQLLAAIKYKVGPYHNVLQYTIAAIAKEHLRQYKDGQFPEIELTMRNPQSYKKGLFFVERFSRDDVPDSLHVDVTVPITSAMDKMQQIQFARQALEPPQLMSRETLWDEILDIQDSDQEKDRIIEDQTIDDPMVRRIKTIQELHDMAEEAEREGKQKQAAYLKVYASSLEAQVMPPKQTGTPTRPPGMPPEALPPEMTGQNPDMMKAALGIGPPKVNRPKGQAQRMMEARNAR